jgi:hypothetical protein
MRNFKRLQGQARQSIMSEKLVEGVEGRPGAGHSGDWKDMAQGYSSLFHPKNLRKRHLISRAIDKAKAGGESHDGTT